jgi:neutral ceramidase
MNQPTARSCFLVLFLACAGQGLAGASEQGAWKAGVARAVITPEKPMWLAGYGHRSHPAEGKIHDLWIKVLALEDPEGRRAVVLTSDLLNFPKAMHESICGKLREKHGLDRAQVMLTVSHTHSGPVLRESLYPCYPLDGAQLALIEEYSTWLEGKIVDEVGVALSRLAPAKLTSGQGKATFAVNRRNNREAEVAKLIESGAELKGPVDHDVPVLAVRSLEGDLKAVVFGYACHNTNLDTYPWCGDYAGFAQLDLEKKHTGATAMFWIGCGADQNPLPRRSLALCEKYGGMLAAGAEDALSKPMTDVPPKLRTAFELITLDFAKSPTREELEKTAASANVVYARWAKGLLEQLKDGKALARTYEYPVQVWRLGDSQLWIALGGEVVVDYSLRFKKEFGPRTWVTGYANDVMGYIPSNRVWTEGGYESGALHEYGEPAEGWAAGVEDRIAEAVHRLAR